jgi:hypothetical protein
MVAQNPAGFLAGFFWMLQKKKFLLQPLSNCGICPIYINRVIESFRFNLSLSGRAPGTPFGKEAFKKAW